MKRLTLLIYCALFVISCNSEPPEPKAEIVDFTSVKVIWTGEYEVDGCGFFVEVDSIRYKPTNEDFLNADFQILNDTIVEMRYLDLNRKITSQCGEGFPYEIRGIEVIGIR